MSVALVGTTGAVSQGAAGAAVTPAWGANENRVAGNLLICWCTGTGAATLPTTPSGWSIASQVAGTSCSSTIYYNVAAGGDAAPTIALATSVVWSVALAEFSGVMPTAPLDKAGTATGTTSAQTVTNSAVDPAPGDLVVLNCAFFYSAAGTNPAWGTTFNNGGSGHGQANSTSTVNHYGESWSVPKTNAAADNCAVTFTTTSITGAASVLASFVAIPVRTEALMGVG